MNAASIAMSTAGSVTRIDGPPQNRPPVVTVGGLLRHDRIRGMVDVTCAVMRGTT